MRGERVSWFLPHLPRAARVCATRRCDHSLRCQPRKPEASPSRRSPRRARDAMHRAGTGWPVPPLRRECVRARSSLRFSSALAIHFAIWRISGSFMPRVVSAGVPMRMPLGLSGGLVSYGIAFLLTVMPALPSASSRPRSRECPSRRHPPASGGCRFRRRRGGSLPPAARRPAPWRWRRSARHRCWNSGRSTSPNATALAAMMCTSGPPCWPGNTALSMAVPMV